MGFLADALAIAEPEGYVRTFVDEGKLLGPLLKKTFARGISPEYAARLVDIIQNEQGRDLATAKGAVLSRKELEVLRLVADGLTSQEICEKLAVSPNTAKTHVRHILDKLDSRGRVQAVARAER